MKENISTFKEKENSPKSQLSVLIYKVRKLEKSKYTSKSWGNLSKALKEAEECFYNNKSTNDKYTSQLHKLTMAREDLERKTSFRNILLAISLFVKWAPICIIVIFVVIVCVVWKNQFYK
ncbi:hypothetical protein NGC25_12200 [Enterococcus faecalis]|uniref:hypothetical protein n=1 Tax=Enterococcus faecalis TaxID=1351 RepID=UPI001386FD7E|nr:hypothetical protein [Enterococcus faecalis]MEB7428039.1 hypothetical protein [Enterococcus faecalis]